MLGNLLHRTGFAARFGRNAITSEGAWNGAWRRLFTSEAASKATTPSRTFWQSNTTVNGAMWRYGSTRPKFPSSATRGWTTASARRGFRFSAWRRNNTTGEQATEAKLTLSQRLKKLSKEYGWAAVGVYLGLSVLDFPFCFLLVRIVGTDTIGKILTCPLR